MKVIDIMTKKPIYLNIKATVAEAAKLMKDKKIGSIPIEENDKLVGMVTDRDITVRVVGSSKDPSKTHVKDVMTADILYCRESDDINAVLDNMGEKQIRRLPVLNEHKKLVGEISIGDIAIHAKDQHTLEHLGKALYQICQVSKQHAS